MGGPVQVILCGPKQTNQTEQSICGADYNLSGDEQNDQVLDESDQVLGGISVIKEEVLSPEPMEQQGAEEEPVLPRLPTQTHILNQPPPLFFGPQHISPYQQPVLSGLPTQTSILNQPPP